MKRAIFYIIIAVLQIILGFLAWAQPPLPMPDDLNRLWVHKDHILSRFGLRKILREEMAPFRTLKYEKFTELKLLLCDPTPNKEKVLAKMKDAHDLIWQMVEKKICYRLAFKDTVTCYQLGLQLITVMLLHQIYSS